MSELKSYDLVDIQDYRGEVYLKSEVDKHIRELEEKCFKDLQDAEDSFKSVLELNRKEIRHSNHKWCLAMAKWCAAEYDIYNLTPRIEKVELYRKWRKRWLELAEKFKDSEH